MPTLEDGLGTVDTLEPDRRLRRLRRPDDGPGPRHGTPGISVVNSRAARTAIA